MMSMPITIKVATNPCLMCHKPSTVLVDKDKYDRWRAGELIQRVWPDWTPDQRELLQTGTHPACWDEMFKGED
jgi:hypothetical protein